MRLPARGAVVPPAGSFSFPWLGLLAVLFWGASFVAIRIALEAYSPAGLVSLRLVLATVFLGAVSRWKGRALLPEPADRKRCLLLGAILSGHMLLQTHGLVYTSAIHTGWIIGLTPLTIAVGAHVAFGQRLGALGWLGTGLGFLGVLFVSLDALPDFEQARFGDGLQLLSCGTWTLYSLLALRPVRSSGGWRVTTLAMGSAASVLVVVACVGGFTTTPPGLRATAALAFLALACSALAFVLWMVSQERAGAQRTATTLYAEPLFTMLFATLLLEESLGWRVAVGGLAVLVGTGLVARDTRRRATSR